MAGYQDYRAAARRGVDQAGGAAILVEDQPAQPVSPRNACLDLVASCDAMVCIVGPRGGYRAPSGKLVVQEEFDEAQARGIPTVLLVHDVERDASGEQLARELSEWVGGRLRRTFSSPEGLAKEVQRALAPLLDSMKETPVDPTVVQSIVEEAQHGGGQYDSVLRTVFAPTVVDEVVDPLHLDTDEFQQMVQREAHDCKLFAYESSKDVVSASDRLTIEQSGSGSARESSYAEISIASSGLVAASAQVNSLTERDRAYRSSFFSSTFEILRSDLERASNTAFDFLTRVLGHVDPHVRYGSWIYNCALVNPGMRSIVDKPAHSNSGSAAGWNQPAVVTAYDRPRSINRSTLAQPHKEIRRVVTLLRKRLDEMRNPY